MKVTCPRHEDTNPSCEVYETHGYCFSGCGSIPLSELGFEQPVVEHKPKENVRATLEYIATLPTKLIRGLELPYDDKGYYIVWPNEFYYKLRHWDGKLKYKNPGGWSQPLFVANSTMTTTLVIIEGELNALSLATLKLPLDIVSLGAASQFTPKLLSKALTQAYQHVILVLDADPAGILATIKAKSYLLGKVPKITTILHPKPDFNDILTNEGYEKLKETFINYLRKEL